MTSQFLIVSLDYPEKMCLFPKSLQTFSHALREIQTKAVKAISSKALDGSAIGVGGWPAANFVQIIALKTLLVSINHPINGTINQMIYNYRGIATLSCRIT